MRCWEGFLGFVPASSWNRFCACHGVLWWYWVLLVCARVCVMQLNVLRHQEHALWNVAIFIGLTKSQCRQQVRLCFPRFAFVLPGQSLVVLFVGKLCSYHLTMKLFVVAVVIVVAAVLGHHAVFSNAFNNPEYPKNFTVEYTAKKKRSKRKAR